MLAIASRIARASAFTSFLIFTNLTAAGIDRSHATQVAAAVNPHIAAPDQPGPFNVGVTVFTATMTGGRTTRVQVFYPTAEPVDCAMRYRIDYLAGFFELHHPYAHTRMPWLFRGGFHWLFTIMAAPGPEPTSSESRRFLCTKPWQAMVS